MHANAPSRQAARLCDKTASNDDLRALSNLRHSRPRHPGKRLNFPVERARLGDVRPMLQRVAIAHRRAAAGPVHPANLMAPHGWRLARFPAPLRNGAASWHPASAWG